MKEIHLLTLDYQPNGWKTVEILTRLEILSWATLPEPPPALALLPGVGLVHFQSTPALNPVVSLRQWWQALGPLQTTCDLAPATLPG